MGIRHLETFMRKNVPNGFVAVSLEKEIKLFQDTHPNVQPILLFDLMGLNKFFNRKIIDNLCAGRQNVFEMMLDDLFIKLKETGAELVFYEDGSVSTKKYDTYIKRQDQKYVKSIQLQDLINDGCPLNDIVEKNASSYGNLISEMGSVHTIEICARRHGTLTSTFTVECDTEMAEYASKTPAVLAIMADDSDFLIYSGNWRYFSLRHLDCDSLMTKEYSRIELRNYLKLSDTQMVVLSTLGGNDVMQYENVMSFHSRICGPNIYSKFNRIANYIKNSLPTTYDELVFEIGKQVLYDTSHEALECIHNSMTFYDTNFEKQDCNSANPLLNKCLEKGFNFIYSVLTDSPINYSLMNFDLRQDDCPLYFDIVIPLAQRQFGILLQHKKKSDIQLKIFIQKNHNETMRLHYVSPVYPPVVTPPLMDLMFDDGDDNEHLEDLRFNLFKWLICWERLGNLDLKAIPKEYFLEIMTLVIMKNHGIITTLEADIFLLTLKSAHLKLCTNEIQYPEVINSKAYRIAFIFIKIRSHVIRSFQIVGLCNYSKSTNFDGVFFHISYLRFIESADILEFLIRDLNDCRLYKE